MLPEQTDAAPATRFDRAWPGKPFPLGATWDGEGTNFALWSSTATGAFVCLFDPDGTEARIPLGDTTYRVWHGYLPGVGPGQRYGFRLDGPYDPAQGLFHNPAKLLVDPYARAIEGAFVDNPAVRADSDTDSAPFVPRSVTVHEAFPWGADHRPLVPWDDTVIYELHVRGFTMRHPGIPEQLRGTYAGLAQPAAIKHLTDLGVTAVELLPIHHFVSEPHLQAKALTNYWGYNSLGFFAPHEAYSSRKGNQVREFKAMVRALHAAGIEVILDVVYNHTAEAGPDGPVLSFRGIDNPSYYRLDVNDPSKYVDYTGCGNTFDPRHPFPLQLITDSLRYWITEMHVDGFRFDLASALARSLHDVDKLSSFFDTIHQDPVISQAKLIAEPWDVGAGGYQVGEFPPLWTEWNGKFRDSVRDFWAHGDSGIRDLAYRLAGSSDLYGDDGRLPFASINFVTAHDGFTMRDLVSYEHKHNEANGEDNRDGTDDNRSYNCGVEGETDDRGHPRAAAAAGAQPAGDAAAVDRRTDARRRRRAVAHPGRQQQRLLPGQRDIVDRLVRLPRGGRSPRADQAAHRAAACLARPAPAGLLRRPRGAWRGDGCKDLAWFHPTGRELVEQDWFDAGLRSIGMYLDGRGLRHRDGRGRMIEDDSYLLLLHAGDAGGTFTLPEAPWGESYEVVLDTTRPAGALDEAGRIVVGCRAMPIGARSSVLLRVRRG